jgi:hypothetical protein
MYEIEVDSFSVQLAKCASLNQQIGHGKAMLEVQAWAEEHKDMLRGIGLHDSLVRLTVPK